MKTAYLDCFSGISGDMFLGALLDAGLPLQELEQRIRTLPLRNYSLETKRESRNQIFGTQFAVKIRGSEQVPRNLEAVRQIIRKGDFSETVKDKAVAIFFGDGPQKKEIINIKEKYEVGDRIKIMDYTSELWSWFKTADVFVSVSHYEGNPNTVLEAVASKCPVVISDIPEHREILEV